MNGCSRWRKSVNDALNADTSGKTLDRHILQTADIFRLTTNAMKKWRRPGRQIVISSQMKPDPPQGIRPLEQPAADLFQSGGYI